MEGVYTFVFMLHLQLEGLFFPAFSERVFGVGGSYWVVAAGLCQLPLLSDARRWHLVVLASLFAISPFCAVELNGWDWTWKSIPWVVVRVEDLLLLLSCLLASIGLLTIKLVRADWRVPPYVTASLCLLLIYAAGNVLAWAAGTSLYADYEKDPVRWTAQLLAMMAFTFLISIIPATVCGTIPVTGHWRWARFSATACVIAALCWYLISFAAGLPDKFSKTVPRSESEWIVVPSSEN